MSQSSQLAPAQLASHDTQVPVPCIPDEVAVPCWQVQGLEQSVPKWAVSQSSQLAPAQLASHAQRLPFQSEWAGHVRSARLSPWSAC